MKNTKRIILSLLLMAAMICSLLPGVMLTALATSVPDSNRYDLADGSITISAGTNNGAKVTYGSSFKDDISLSENIEIFCSVASTSNTIAVNGSLSGTVNITLNTSNIDVSGTPDACAFSIGSGTTVNLTLSGSSSLTSGSNSAGLHVPVGAALTVIKNSSGSLSATGGSTAAGIGGGYEETAGTITIEDGTVSATGGMSGAGIGGGCDGAGGTIVISGGTVAATGGDIGGGAGIGGGNSSDGGTIRISGGSVTAKSNDFGAGIGGGMYAAGGEITIVNGIVIATGGESGAGIGGGRYGAGGTISIEGGSVTATSSAGDVGGGAGIGGGRYGNGGTTVIKGGTVIAQGGDSGAGIGSGDGYYADPTVSAGAITISEGTVMATGGKNGAGIGGGYSSDGGTITIDGGTVIAQGGSSGAGIGGGKSGVGGTVTINDKAVIKAVSNGITRPAIHTASGSLAPTGTASVLMVNFAAQKNANASTAIIVKDDSSSYASVTPTAKYQSVAFTVSAGTCRLKSANLLQQKTSTNTGIDFVISAAGLTVFSGVTAAKTYTVSIGALSGGSITPSQTSAAAGEKISINITPTAGMQLKVGSLVYNDGTDHAITGTSFTMPAVNVTIKAEFELPSHSITVSANPAGGGNVSGGGTYSEGASVTATATPSGGYTFVNWTEGVNEVSKNSSYSFSMGTSDRNLSANFTAANALPNRKAGAPAKTTANVTVNTPYTLDLAAIFEDTDGDTLNFKVSVNNASYATVDAKFSYNPTSEGQTVLVFMANDGKADSTDTYTVTLSAANASPGGNGIFDGGSQTTETSKVKVIFNSVALAAVEKKTNGNYIVKAVQSSASSLSDEAKALVGSRPIYNLSVVSGDTTVSDFGGGKVTVSIPYTLANGEDANKIVIYLITAAGELIMVPDCIYDASSETVTFTTTHFSTYAVAYNDVSFTDVSGWYTDYVSYLAARGIIGGTGDGKFSPDASITRAQFVTILARMSGDELSGYTASSFSDVATTDWYFAAVQWAYKNGVASGSDGKFNPNATITRQDIAVMLARYADEVASYTLPKTNSTVTFTDSAMISSYASDAVTAMQQAGFISGNSDGSFAPTANATRAQAAKMIAVLLQSMVKAEQQK